MRINLEPIVRECGGVLLEMTLMIALLTVVSIAATRFVGASVSQTYDSLRVELVAATKKCRGGMECQPRKPKIR